MQLVIDERRPELSWLWKLSELEQTSQDEASCSLDEASCFLDMHLCIFLKYKKEESPLQNYTAGKVTLHRKYQNSWLLILRRNFRIFKYTNIFIILMCQLSMFWDLTLCVKIRQSDSECVIVSVTTFSPRTSDLRSWIGLFALLTLGLETSSI